MKVKLNGMTILSIATISILARRSAFAFVARNPASRKFSVQPLGASTLSTGINEEQLIQDMLYRIREINSMPNDVRSSLVPFRVDGVDLGKVHPNMVNKLIDVDNESGSVFELNDETSDQYLTLSEKAGKSSESRSAAVATVMEKLRDDGTITGWRDELYPVSDTFYNPAMFLMERAAVNVLGILEYGVHVNGLVQESTKSEPQMWIARRSATKSKFPGMLDHIVAGGQPAGLGLLENVIKECEEEAGIPEEIARSGVQAVGAISYEHSHNEKISRVVLFNYDLYLPNDFVPKPVDGEVEDFFLWNIDQIKDSMAVDYHDPIKPNCYVVIIDYLLRMGYISPETPGYLDVLRELRSGDCR